MRPQPCYFHKLTSAENSICHNRTLHMILAWFVRPDCTKSPSGCQSEHLFALQSPSVLLKSDTKYEILKMAGKITINTEMCKGCGLCVAVCPKGCIVISRHSNKHGFFPTQTDNTNCTGCTKCAVICPDVVIEVCRESNIVAVDSGKKKHPNRQKSTSSVRPE